MRRGRRALIPRPIASLIGDGDLEPVEIGRTQATVFRIRRRGQQTIFLKCSPLTACDVLAEEAKRLDWLQRRLSVPRVISFSTHDGWEYLVTTALAGVNGVDAGSKDPAIVVNGLANALSQLHARAVDGCPFDERRDARVARAYARLQNGCVDETDFDEERHGLTAAQVWNELETHPPLSEEPVLTHGDPCLPNILFDGERVTGFVDCGRVGLADAYQDLALASRSIAGNLGEKWVEPFFTMYGLHALDDQKLRFYRLLDEFF